MNSTKSYGRDVTPDNWMTPLGYNVKVWSQDERDSMNIDNLNKLNAVASMFPGNAKMDEIKKRKALGITSLTPEEINEIMQEDEKNKQNQTATPPKENIQIAYKDAPPDIQRQMEQAAGFKPSQVQTMGAQPTTGVPTANPPTATAPVQPLPTMVQPQNKQPGIMPTTPR